jgi:hypothetical protein
MMRRLLTTVLFAAMTLSLGLIAKAQDAKPEESAGPANSVISEGTTAKLSLQTRLHSKLSEVGDEVTAVLYEPVRGSDGRVAIPRGTEFLGRVTQVQAAKRPQKQATMTVAFDTMRMPYGTEKIAVTVTAIDDFANDNKMKSKGDEEGKVGAGHSGERTAKNAGIGGGLGSLGGLIARGGLGGLGAGAGAGAVGGVLMTKGNDIKLEPGTILRIKFDRSVKLPAFDGER